MGGPAESGTENVEKARIPAKSKLLPKIELHQTDPPKQERGYGVGLRTEQD